MVGILEMDVPRQTSHASRRATPVILMMRMALIILLLQVYLTTSLAQQANPSTSLPSVPQSVSDLLERATKLSKAGRGQLAITLIQEAMRISPDSPAVYLALGNEFVKAGRLDEAVAEFEKARKLNPRDDQVYLSIGLVMLQQKKYAVAASLFTDASNINPNEPLHQFMRGVALARQASDEESSRPADRARHELILSQAEEALTKAFDLSGGQIFEVHLFRAMVYEMKGARLEAASELEKYLKANPDSDKAGAVREAIRNLRTKAAPSP